MRAMLGLLLTLLLPVGASAASNQLAASMLVTGTITVNPDGSVQGYTLDDRAELPGPVLQLIGKTIPGWRFVPVVVDGQDVRAEARMSLRIVGQQIKPGSFLARVEGAQFGNHAAAGNGECEPGACVTYSNKQPPVYPMGALRDRAAGTVYLVQEIGRDGRVVDQVVRQVNLRVRGSAGEMNYWRRLFAESALSAGKNWTYRIPTSGANAEKRDWTVVTPVNYTLSVDGRAPARLDQPGHWDVYIPGPVQPIPWARDEAGRAGANGSADAIPDNGQPFVADSRFVLLTPLGDGSLRAPAAQPGQG